ncbi:MAG: TlpA family protein disulfide reductase [Gammaproteobacteria bacterium]
MTRIVAIAFICLAAALWAGRTYRNAAPANDPGTSDYSHLADFTVPDLADRPRSIMEWSGRPLIINFWATWCAPCRREMPLLQNLYDERGDSGLHIVGVAMDNKRDVQRFVAQIKVTYPILYGEDEGARAADSFGDSFVGLPFSAFIAPGGEVLALRAGELQADDLARLVGEMDAVASGVRSAAQARERLIEH